MRPPARAPPRTARACAAPGARAVAAGAGRQNPSAGAKRRSGWRHCRGEPWKERRWKEGGERCAWERLFLKGRLGRGAASPLAWSRGVAGKGMRRSPAGAGRAASAPAAGPAAGAAIAAVRRRRPLAALRARRHRRGGCHRRPTARCGASGPGPPSRDDRGPDTGRCPAAQRPVPWHVGRWLRHRPASGRARRPHGRSRR